MLGLGVKVNLELGVRSLGKKQTFAQTPFGQVFCPNFVWAVTTLHSFAMLGHGLGQVFFRFLGFPSF